MVAELLFAGHKLVVIIVEHSDLVFARRVEKFLTQIGFDVRINETHGPAHGSVATERRIHNIRDADVVVPIVSTAFLTSSENKTELDYANAKKMPLVSLLLAPWSVVRTSPVGFVLTGPTRINLEDGEDRAFEELRRALQSVFALGQNAPTNELVAPAEPTTKHRWSNASSDTSSSTSASASASGSGLSVVATSVTSSLIGRGAANSGTSTTTSTTTSSTSTSGGFSPSSLPTTLPAYFQIQESGTSNCISAATYATCESSPSSTSQQVFTATLGNASPWKQTASSECLTFFGSSLSLTACDTSNSFQTLTYSDYNIVDGLGSCLPANLQTNGGTGCGTFIIVTVS
ncbi:hypothetical protein HK405_012106 [Cladochytrium tenue]|nr:hypothetical protein HK405_012106 [Cladochytrium tenue]